MFDLVRETIGTKEFYCHFSGVEHRTGNAMHYTQIKKSDLNFEPLAEFIVEEGGWLDITLISDSPLLEHDAMYMLQNIEKARHKQLERKAREDRRRSLAAQTGRSAEEIKARELEIASARTKAATAEMKQKAAEQQAAEAKAPAEKQSDKATEEIAKPKTKASKNKKAEEKSDDDVFDFDEEDEDLFWVRRQNIITKSVVSNYYSGN